MNQFIAIFIPAFLALYIENVISEKKLSGIEIIINYFVYMLFTNMGCYLIYIYIFKKIKFIYTATFTLKYLLLGTIISIILSFISTSLKKNINLKLRTEKNDKETK